MPTQYVTPQDKQQMDVLLANIAQILAVRSNPEVRFDPAAHILEFEFGTKRTTVIVALDELDAFDRLITEQDFVEVFEPKIV